MKRFLFAAALYVCAFTLPACAQMADPKPASPATLGEYYDQWTPRQWQALQNQLLTSLRAPVDEIDADIEKNDNYGF